ncbi:MAG: protoporphyrinogen oxidase, partial [Chloroflexi bacterium]|nr:protoporphyrinogen oxidase [Chloroflexota bacterium]
QQGDFEVVVLEQDAQWGGKIQTTRPKVEGLGEFIVDGGPDTFITRKPEVWTLVHELGLGDQLVKDTSEHSGIYILHDAQPIQLKMDPLGFALSPIMSIWGKLRMLAEPLIPARRDDGDESLAEFATRRLGREALERLIGPVLGGIYNADPETQSIMYTSSVMREMEREYGGLFAGTIGRMRAKRKCREAGEEIPPSFVTFKDGGKQLIDELVEQSTADLRLNTAVVGIERSGDSYRIVTDDGSEFEATAVILATPANVAARFLPDIAPEAARLLETIRHTNLGTMSLAYRRTDIDLDEGLRGLMIPRKEDRAIDAITVTSAKAGSRAPEGLVMLRVYFGGAQPETATMREAELVATIRGELRDLLNLDAEPVMCQAFRWVGSYPAADAGHLERVAQIEELLPEGLLVSGSSYRGLGVPDCVRQGRQAAQSIIETITA